MAEIGLEKVLNDSQTTYLDIHNAMEKTTPKTKAIIFDLGDVVVPYKMKDFARAFHHIFHPMKPQCENIETLVSQKKLELIRNYEKGMPSEEFFREMGRLLNIPFGYNLMKNIEQVEYSFFKPIDKKMYCLLNTLSSKYSLAVLSNITKPHKDHVFKTYPLNEMFDYLFFSCDAGMRKPEPEFYEHALKVMNIKPKEAVFIDDNKLNVEGGKDAGIPSILFSSIDKLMEDLKQISVI